MSSSARSRGWFQVNLKSLFLFTLVVAAFCAGWSVADRRADKAIQDAQEAADVARKQEEQTRRELEVERQPRFPPCHPGCFPAGTLVRVPQGATPIERIREGDRVITVGLDGRAAVGKVVSVFVTRNRLVTVRTDAGSLETTQTQPVCLETGELRAAGELQPGDVVWRWDGSERKAAIVGAVTAGRVAAVFNVVLGDPTVFIAGDFLVRSKPPPEPDPREE
jgi:Hint domain